MFSIEDATEEDIPAIIEVAEQTWWSTYSRILSPEQIRYMLEVIYAPEILVPQLRDKIQTYLVLRANEKIQGFVAYSPNPEDTSVYKIQKLYVLPQLHKKGYGRALVTAVADRLRANGIRYVDLNVNRYNSARGFYERLGFRVIREEDIPIGPYWMNDYVMRLAL